MMCKKHGVSEGEEEPTKKKKKKKKKKTFKCLCVEGGDDMVTNDGCINLNRLLNNTLC